MRNARQEKAVEKSVAATGTKQRAIREDDRNFWKSQLWEIHKKPVDTEREHVHNDEDNATK